MWFGLCFPSSCSESDIGEVVTHYLESEEYEWNELMLGCQANTDQMVLEADDWGYM